MVFEGSIGKFFDTEKASPELMALGASLAESNPLKAKAFREEDMRWAKMSQLTRSVSRLSVFSVVLSFTRSCRGIGHNTRGPRAYSVSYA